MTKPKSPSLKTKDPKLKKFISQFKLYFSSLSARGANYLYFGLSGLEDGFVLTNGDYELLTSFVPTTLSVHIVRFKNPEFLLQLKEFLKFHDYEPYVVRVNMLCSAFNSNNQDDLTVVVDNSHNRKLANLSEIIAQKEEIESYGEDPEDLTEVLKSEDNPFGFLFEKDSIWFTPTFSDATIFGKRIDNVRALCELEEIVCIMKDWETAYLSKPHVVKTLDWNSCAYFNSNYYHTQLDLSEFWSEELNAPHFDTEQFLPFRCALVDGYDTPSMKEFVKKVDSKVKVIAWVDRGGTIKHQALYETEDVKIVSMRPYWDIVPISRKPKTASNSDVEELPDAY